MSEEVSDLDVLLWGFSSPTLDDLVHPTNEWTDQLNEKRAHDANDAKGKGLLSPGEPQENGPTAAYQSEAQVLEEEKVHDSNKVKGKEILPEPEPKKKKSSKRNGSWSEEGERLLLSGLHKYSREKSKNNCMKRESNYGKWKYISRHIGTRSPDQVRTHARWMESKRSSIQDIQSLPLETNKPIANPGHLPFPRTVHPMMEPMVVPPPCLPLLRPEQDGGYVCYLSSNLRAEMGANPSSRISDQLWNSTNILSSDSHACQAGPSAYGNNMNPGQ